MPSSSTNRLRHCPPAVVQSIASTALEKPENVVKRLGVVQAQDYSSALWAVGLRMKAATEQTIEQAISDRKFIRTWPMRGTLHFVASEDVRWMLPLLTPRIIAKATRRHKQLELDAARLTGFRHHCPAQELPRQPLICCPGLMSICWATKSAAPCSTWPC
jgi:hypothetical protein